MSPEQNKIMGYFIEEAKEHLNTIEQGLLHLTSTVADAHRISEVFRAAHSIKGSAAMLELNSIQQIAHVLENGFKILKEIPVDIDQKLESLFLEVFDSLKTLLANLSSPRGLSPQDAAQISSKAEPTIKEMIAHLELLTEKARVVSHFPGEATRPATRAAPMAPATKPVPASQPTLEEDSALQLIFKSDVPKLLQQMLETCQQPDGSASRQQLSEICRNLLQAGETFELREWNDLIQTIALACQNPHKTYHALAPVILKEIKQARQLVLTGKVSEIKSSQELKSLLPPVETEQTSTDKNSTNLDRETLITMTSNYHDNPDNDWLSEKIETGEDPLPTNSTNKNTDRASEPQLERIYKNNHKTTNKLNQGKTKGPEVGAAELNSLADLFEGENLEITGWDEEIFETNQESLDLEVISDSDEIDYEDFSDLLCDSDELDGQTITAGNHRTNLEENIEENNESELFDEISQLTAEGTKSNDKPDSQSIETLTSDIDDSFEDLFDLDDINESELNVSSSSPVEDLNSLFDEASDEELDLNWNSEIEPLDSSSAAEDLDPIWDVEESGLTEVPKTIAISQNPGQNQLEDELDLSLFDDPSESENNELVSDSCFDEIVPIDESANVADEVNYDDLFPIEEAGDKFGSIVAKDPQKESVESATESLEELFGSLPDSAETNLEDLFADRHAENAENLADIFGEDELEVDSLGEPEIVAASAAEDLGDWLNFDLLETEEKPPQNVVDFSDINDLFNDDEDFDSSDETLAFERRSSEATEATAGLFDDELGLNSLEWADDESGPELFATEANDGTETTDLYGLLELDSIDASESENSDIWDELLSIETANLLESEIEVIESESASNLPTATEQFSELERFLDRDVDRSASSTADFGELEQLLDEPSAPLKLDFGELEAFLAQESRRDSEPFWFTELQELLEEKNSDASGASMGTQTGSVQDRDSDTAVATKVSAKEKSVPAATTPRSGMGYQIMRVPVKQLDNLGNLIGELVVNRNTLEQDQERMRQFLDNLLHQVQNLTDVGQRMQDLYERVLLEIALLSSRRQNHHFMPSGNQQMSHGTGHDLSVFEMDKFTPFHTLAQEILELIVRVRESASDIEFLVDETDQVTRQLRQITNKLQEGINRSRMVPFAQTADRLPRGVRDNSIKFGKQVELVVEGAETLIDKMILENLNDPMTHLVNNALAHGIEGPEDRQRKGKSPKGRITVRAFHQGNQTVISVSDDGAGIDAERVKAKALERGLVTPEEAKTLSRLEVYDLLFAPGFTTIDIPTPLAGRGVGMDVVRTNLSAIRGVVNIDSTLGKGTTFTIRVPLAFSISKALICISDRARIAFPMDGVEDMLDVPRDKIQTTSEDETFIPWRDTMLPFRPMRDLLVYHRHLGRGSVFGGNAEEDIISVVVLRSAGNYLALEVDQVLGEQEIVIKQLEGPIPKPIGIAGATVMGDGRIVAIADVLELIDLAAGRISEKSSSVWEEASNRMAEEAVIQEQPTVLIVDDSITVRELLSMTFNKAGYRVEQARDGQEAWEKLKSGLPCDIVFCDIEMPRMDGLELLSRLQKDSQLAHLPMAMLTSRGAKKHMQMAIDMGARGYFTKPYLEEALLEAASRMLKGDVLVPSASEV